MISFGHGSWLAICSSCFHGLAYFLQLFGGEKVSMEINRLAKEMKIISFRVMAASICSLRTSFVFAICFCRDLEKMLTWSTYQRQTAILQMLK